MVPPDVLYLIAIFLTYLFAMVAGFIINQMHARNASIRELIHEEASTCRALLDAAKQYKMGRKHFQTFRACILRFLDCVIKDWTFRGMDEEKVSAELHNLIEVLEVKDLRHSQIFNEILRLLSTINHTRSSIVGLYESRLGVIFWTFLGGLGTAILTVFLLIFHDLGYSLLSCVVMAMLPWLATIILFISIYYYNFRISTRSDEKTFNKYLTIPFYILYFLTLMGLLIGFIFAVIFYPLFLLLVIWSITTLTLLTVFDLRHSKLGFHRISVVPYEVVWRYIAGLDTNQKVK